MYKSYLFIASIVCALNLTAPNFASASQVVEVYSAVSYAPDTQLAARKCYENARAEIASAMCSAQAPETKHYHMTVLNLWNRWGQLVGTSCSIVCY